MNRSVSPFHVRQDGRNRQLALILCVAVLTVPLGAVLASFPVLDDFPAPTAIQNTKKEHSEWIQQWKRRYGVMMTYSFQPWGGALSSRSESNICLPPALNPKSDSDFAGQLSSFPSLKNGKV